MATLKEHQAAMVDLLANGSGIPASASRLAHAMHDVLVYLSDGRNVPLSSITGVEYVEYKQDATTPGLNDKALSKREKALKTDSPAKWPTPAEQRVKELENTIRQLKANNAKLKQERDEIRKSYESVMPEFDGLHSELSRLQEQAGCRKPDTQVCEHEWSNSSYTAAYCVKCGATKL